MASFGVRTVWLAVSIFANYKLWHDQGYNERIPKKTIGVTFILHCH
jgi:hypothetical protein